jgi:hypothetical protein
VIFDEFVRAAGPGWVRGEIRYRMVGKIAETDLFAYDSDGDLSYPDLGGFALDRAVREIRSQMAQPSSGAWFSAKIELTPDGGFSMDADYDDEPEWDVPVVAETYLEEQELFPRDEANQPDWYRQKLQEAAADKG